MKTLLMQVYEAGTFHDNAVTQKRGLREALATYGEVLDWDYLANDRATLFDGLVIRLDTFQPDLVFTQFHAADMITPAQMHDLKARYPFITFVNWSGDSWAWSLTSPEILALAQAYDLWLVAAPDVLPVYEANGIHAAFWQIGLEQPIPLLPEMPVYDVVMLGNVISDRRRALFEFLRTLPYKVGIYGDWLQADGQNTYDFAAGEALYKNATIAIADCAYPDQANYISNRPFQVLAANGALLLHQHVEKMDILSGLQSGKHYIDWTDFADLEAKIDDWIHPEKAKARKKIVQAGYKFALKNHTWAERVRVLVLVEELMPTIEKVTP